MASGYAFVHVSVVGVPGSRIHIVDVSGPTGPREVAALNGGPGMAVAGGYLYLTDGAHTLRVIDLADPSNPTEVGRFDYRDSSPPGTPFLEARRLPPRDQHSGGSSRPACRTPW